MDPTDPPLRARARTRRPIVILRALVLCLVAPGLLFVLLCFLLRPRLGPALIETHHTDAMELRRAVEVWRGTHAGNACPTLAQLREDRAVGPQSKLTDPWGTPFVITCEEDETIITSLGPDRKPSEDDLVTPEYARDAGRGARP